MTGPERQGEDPATGAADGRRAAPFDATEGSPLDRLAAAFDQAIALPSEEDRRRLLDGLESKDPEVARELVAILDAHFQETAFLEGTLPEASTELLSRHLDATLVGRMLGPWKLEALIQGGGMGTVYRAERQGTDFRQTAAVKVLRLGYDQPELLQRFARERRLLARLEHPGIARLLDGGTTPEGLPYLVMEYVPGTPIDQWCDRNAPDVERILSLFREVADAVHFAHQNLVVHRDIKPSNILVTEEGRVKLLDFGIAKLMEESAGGSELTQLRLMTPAWASPEQFRGEATGIGTDIYSLGVLLYRLLAGTPPYRMDGETTAREAEDLVCRTVPPPPSQRLSGSDRRRRQVRGDLDTIVMKAIRKEPERRYGSVLSMVEDLERFRRGLPVMAQPDSLGYRIRKFTGRNRVGVGALAGILLALGAGLGVALWQSAEAERQRDLARLEATTAESAVEFLKTVLWSGHPWEEEVPIETLDDLMVYARTQVDPLLGDQPVTRAYILAALAEIAAGRGELDEALELSAQAIQVLVDELSGEHPREPSILRARALALHEAGELESASVVARQAVEAFRAQEAPFLRGLAEAHNQVGAILLDLGDPVEAEEHLLSALELHGAAGETHPIEMAVVMNNLAGALRLYPDRLEDAAAAYEEALALARRGGAGRAALGLMRSNQAAILWSLGELEGAGEAYHEAVELLSASLGFDHPSTLTTRASLGNFHEGIGELERAEEVLRSAWEAGERTLPPDHPVSAYLQNVLAVTLCRLGGEARAREGLVLARASLETRSASLPPGHWALASGSSVEARCLAELGRLEDARTLLVEAHARLVAERGEDQDLSVRARGWLDEVEARIAGGG